MRCHKARTKLAAFLDGQLSLSQKEELQEHLKACLNCQEQLADLKQLDQALSVSPLAETGANFVPNFWQKVRNIEAKQVAPKTAGAYFNRFALVIFFLSLAIGSVSGISTAKHNAQEQYLSELKIDHLRDYPPDSLSGKNIVLASTR